MLAKHVKMSKVIQRTGENVNRHSLLILIDFHFHFLTNWRFFVAEGPAC